MEVESGGDGWESNPPRTPHSAPQTVLKTAGLPSTAVQGGPLEFDHAASDSRIVLLRPPVSVELAVLLAVSHRQETLIRRFRVRLPARAPSCCVSEPGTACRLSFSRRPRESLLLRRLVDPHWRRLAAIRSGPHDDPYPASSAAHRPGQDRSRAGSTRKGSPLQSCRLFPIAAPSRSACVAREAGRDESSGIGRHPVQPDARVALHVLSGRGACDGSRPGVDA